MSIQSILKQKNYKIDQLVKSFNYEYSVLYPQVFKELQSLFKAGVYNENIIADVFINHGFQELYTEFADEFSSMIKFSKQVSAELGIGFKLTPENYNLLDEVAVQFENNISASMKKYANDLSRIGIQSKFGMSYQQIVQDLKSSIDDSFRRFETEAYTGITQFDSVMNMQLFDNAGIEKFVYVGPYGDGKNRDACLSTLGDPKQDTGWTRAEIDSSETPFVQRGGYNCRHEWLPWVSDIKAPIKQEG